MKSFLKEVTPQYMRCDPDDPTDCCPAIHVKNDDYLIVGETVDPKTVGLENRVGDGETLVRVSKKLIDEKER